MLTYTNGKWHRYMDCILELRLHSNDNDCRRKMGHNLNLVFVSSYYTMYEEVELMSPSTFTAN